MEQKVYLIGGQKVISTAIAQNRRALRRTSRFRLFGRTGVLSRLLSKLKAKGRAGQEALPASFCDEDGRIGLVRTR